MDVGTYFQGTFSGILTPLIFLAIGIWIFAIIVFIIKKFVLKNNNLPYVLNPYILTRRENEFFSVLRPIAEKHNLFVCIKPRMADFISVIFPKSENKSKYFSYFNKISAKHIDFLLVDNTSRPVMGIELDDSTHQQTKRSSRDAFVKNVYNSIGLKTFHLLHYSPEILDECIRSVLIPTSEIIPAADVRAS